MQVLRQIQRRIDRLRTDPPQISDSRHFRDWCLQFLSHYFPIAPSRFHLWLSDRLDRFHAVRGQHLNVLAPRGNAKSTWSTQSYPLWVALNGHEQYVVLAADTTAQASAYIDSIRAEIESNDDLRRAYWPLIRAAKLRQGKITLGNGAVIESASTGGKLRGRKARNTRPTLIVIDDPENIEHAISPTLRQRSWDWLTRDVMYAGSPQTNVIVVGTAIHRESIVCRLENTPGWESHKWKSLDAYPARMDLWEDWQNILWNRDDPEREAKAKDYYESNRAAMSEGCNPLWPERYPLYELMLSRFTNGVAAFESESQNNPINPEACEWPETYFNWPGLMFDAWPDNLTQRIITLDPSKGKDARQGDYSAICLGGKDPRGVCYAELDLARRSVETMLADLVKHVHRFNPDVIAIETNQFQELLKAPLKQMAKDLAVELPRLIEIENQVNKEVRIRRLGPDFSQRLWRFKSRSPGTALTLDQLRDFPTGSHDDGPDALEMARRQMLEKKKWELR